MVTLTNGKTMMAMAASFVNPFQFNNFATALNTQAFNALSFSHRPDDENQLREALDSLHFIDQPVHSSMYVYMLRECIENRALLAGRLIHAHIHQSGLTPHSLCQEWDCPGGHKYLLSNGANRHTA